jgi:hypothetical protein
VTTNWSEARAFIEALGRREDSCRLRGFYHSQNPKKQGDRGRKAGADAAAADEWQADGRGVYLTINPGGDSDKQITRCVAFFVEFDDRPKEDQIAFWEQYGLPEPSIQVDTGGKSIHTYWVLDVPVEPERWRAIQTRLLDYVDGDRTLKNPSRVMRLPGTRHAGPDGVLGALCSVININDNRYVASDIEECLPVEEEEKKRERHKELEVRSLDEIKGALAKIPAAVPKQGQYGYYRNLLWGLMAACVEVGATEADAVELLRDHSPEFREIDACAKYKVEKVGAGTFWYYARQSGWEPERRQRGAEPRRPPVSAGAAVGGDDTDPFACLGFSGTEYYFQPGDSGQVTKLSFKSLSSSAGLVLLADLEWWRDQFPMFSQDGEKLKNPNWLEAANYVIRKSNAVGVYDGKRIRGVGAWWDEGRVVFHLGDRLLFDGAWHPILKQPKSYFLYQRLPQYEGPGEAVPLSVEDGARLLLIAESFHWKSPVNGMLLAGWVALAPIAGALSWRPHVWITGKRGEGKSTVKTDFATPLLSDLACRFQGTATEAGVRQTLKSDSRPVVFDEIESNKPKDVARVKSIIDLVRVSSSAEGGSIVKGSPSGEVMSFEPRSMFLFCSINTALEQASDTSRFCVLEMRTPEELSAEQRDLSWRTLQRELAEFCTIKTGNRLIARMVRMIPIVRETIDVLVPLAAVHFGERRDGDQIGALLAGAWCLTHNDAPTKEEAEAFLASVDLSEHGTKAAGDGGDEDRCLRAIMGASIRVEASDGRGARSVLVAEIVAIVASPVHRCMWLSPDDARTAIGRIGLKVEGGRLLIANSCRGLKELLRGEIWSETGWKRSLATIAGAEASKDTTWFAGASMSQRYVSVPLDEAIQPGDDHTF